MKRCFIIGLFLISASHLFSYNLMYAEEYYQLYHLNLHRYPQDFAANLVYLEQATSAPFMNPINAIAKIETKKEYVYYQALFRMHCNLKMAESYRYLAGEFDKRKAYWFNAPWSEINLKGLKKAKFFYNQALYYWEAAKKWSKVASQFRFLTLEEITFWMDENWRIENNELNYGKYIGIDLARVAKVQAEYEAMNEKTFPLYPGQHPLNDFFERHTLDEIKKANANRPSPIRKPIKGIIDRRKEQEKANRNK